MASLESSSRYRSVPSFSSPQKGPKKSSKCHSNEHETDRWHKSHTNSSSSRSFLYNRSIKTLAFHSPENGASESTGIQLSWCGYPELDPCRIPQGLFAGLTLELTPSLRLWVVYCWWLPPPPSRHHFPDAHILDLQECEPCLGTVNVILAAFFPTAALSNK